jgi:WD40 repeat protein
MVQVELKQHSRPHKESLQPLWPGGVVDLHRTASVTVPPAVHRRHRRCEITAAGAGRGDARPAARTCGGRAHGDVPGPPSAVSGSGWSPDGTRLLTTSTDHTARICDAATGRLVGWQLDQFPASGLAVWSSPKHELLGAGTSAGSSACNSRPSA